MYLLPPILLVRDTLGSQMVDGADEANQANEAKGADEADGANEAG